MHAVTTGTMTLKDAVNDAMREWTRRIDDTHYVPGSVMGPHPFPTIARATLGIFHGMKSYFYCMQTSFLNMDMKGSVQDAGKAAWTG